MFEFLIKTSKQTTNKKTTKKKPTPKKNLPRQKNLTPPENFPSIFHSAHYDLTTGYSQASLTRGKEK